jgi:hypothetical protein
LRRTHLKKGIAPGEFMQQRRLRLGDILDDYCPRERRITNHAVVAMIDDAVKQTRCTTCDADHEYKEARVPASRRRKTTAAPAVDHAEMPRPVVASPAPDVDQPLLAESSATDDCTADAMDRLADDAHAGEGPDDDRSTDDEGPVHRRLIRATLPRPEGQVPERKAPDFTVHQPTGGRGRDGQGGARPGRHRGRRPAGRQQASPGNPMRFGGAPPGQPRHGNRQRPGGGSSSGHASGQGQGRGSRPTGGRGPKRGR